MSFEADDIVKIIKACAKGRVKDLDLGNIKISFIDNSEFVEQNLSRDHSIKNYEFVSEQSDDDTEPVLSEEDEREMLLLTDSDKWERTLRANETEETQYVGARPTL